MKRNEITGIEEKNGRILALLLPALSVGTAMTLFAFLEAVSVFALSTFEVLPQLDSTIQNLLVLLITQLIAAIIVFFVLLPFFKVKHAEFHPISTSSTSTTIALFFIALGTTFLSSLFFTSLFTALNWEQQLDYSEITITADHVNNPFNIVLFLITMTIGAALFEEMVYRRLLIPSLEDNQVAPFVAVFVSSIMFAMAHLDTDLMYGNIVGGFIHTTGVLILSMALGMTYILTRNVIFPVAIHAVFNLLGSLSIFFMLMENEVLLIIHSLLVLAMLGIGIGITIYTAWKYFRGSETDWILIIKKKSEVKVSRGLTGFMVVGLALIYMPNVMKINFSLLNVNSNLSGMLLIACLASILVVLVWLVGDH